MIDITDDINSLVAQVDDGHLRALDLYNNMKELEKLIAQVKDVLFDRALDDAMYDSDYKIVERQTFSFKHLPDWAMQKAHLKSIEDKYKLAYKNAGLGSLSVGESGEVVELPEVTISRSIQSNK